MVIPNYLFDKMEKNKSGNAVTPKSDKRAVSVFILVSFLAIAAVGLTARQWVQSLKIPFLTPESQKVASQSLDNNDLSNLLNLQVKDTDQDGLSDYDELYAHGSSPYLEDSDSDGLKDADEVAKGSNPNCPEGKTCQASGQLSATSTESLSAEELANLSPEYLRSLLIEKGMSAEEVNKLDDATLKQTFLEAANQISPSKDYSYLTENTEIDLSAEQIRQLLTSQGVDAEELDKLSDEELLNVWQQTVDQFKQGNTN